MPNCSYCSKVYKNLGIYYSTHVKECEIRITKLYSDLHKRYNSDLNLCLEYIHILELMDKFEVDEIKLIRNLLSSKLRLLWFQKNFGLSDKTIELLKIRELNKKQ